MPVFYKTKKVETTFYKHLDSIQGDAWRQMELFPKFSASIDTLQDGKYLVRFAYLGQENGKPTIFSDHTMAQECISAYLSQNSHGADSIYVYREQIS
jgi:hypothetical protein